MLTKPAAFVMEPGFPSRTGLCDTGFVKRSIHLCRLLAFFLIVGLVIRPAFGAGEWERHGIDGDEADVR